MIDEKRMDARPSFFRLSVIRNHIGTTSNGRLGAIFVWLLLGQEKCYFQHGCVGKSMGPTSVDRRGAHRLTDVGHVDLEVSGASSCRPLVRVF